MSDHQAKVLDYLRAWTEQQDEKLRRIDVKLDMLLERMQVPDLAPAP